MDDGLADQVRFYELALAACRQRPALHAAQIAALEAHLELARRAGTLAALAAALEHGGHATALARAGQIDRFAADRARARALGDPAAESAAIEALTALATAGDAAFPIAIGGTSRAVAHAARAGLAGDQVAQLVIAAIDFACETEPARRADAHRRAVNALITARAVEPGLGLARIMAPPHRHRLPFAAGAAPALRELLIAIFGDTADLDGAPPAPAPAPPPVAAVDHVLALSIEGWPPSDPDRAALAARVGTAAAGDELAAVRAAAAGAIGAERAFAFACDEPALVGLADRALADVAVAATPTEVQALVALHGEVARIERSWWHLLVHTALWPAVVAIADPSHARTAALVAARLLGAEPRVALRAPAVARAIERQLLGAAQSADGVRAIAGPGAAHVGAMRRALALRAVATIEADAARGGPLPDFAGLLARWPALDAFAAEIAGVLDDAGAPRGGDGVVVLWGERVPLAVVDPWLARVPRPRPEGL